MSDVEAGLRAAIEASPGDPVPRLVYADWLDEQGRPVPAEAIRLDVAMAPLRDDPRQNECPTDGGVCYDPECPYLNWAAEIAPYRERMRDLRRLTRGDDPLGGLPQFRVEKGDR